MAAGSDWLCLHPMGMVGPGNWGKSLLHGGVAQSCCALVGAGPPRELQHWNSLDLNIHIYFLKLAHLPLLSKDVKKKKKKNLLEKVLL